MDSVRAIFEQFRDGGEALLNACIGNQEEHLYLDFKVGGDNRGHMTRDDRKNYAEGLSGFANSDGGVLIWGVACRSVGDTPDVVQSLQPINNVRVFISDLNNHAHSLVSPPVMGVEHAIIPSSSGPDSGYVVTYIPKSNGLPHMTIAPDQHRYYFRSGASFCKMEAFMLADRFQRRPQPNLELTYVIHNAVHNDNYHQRVPIDFGVRNIGNGIALYFGLGIRLQTDTMRDHSITTLNNISYRQYQPEYDSRYSNVGTEKNTSSIFIVGDVHDAIHPRTSLYVARASIIVEGEQYLRRGLNVKVDYELHCEGYYSAGNIDIAVPPFLSPS